MRIHRLGLTTLAATAFVIAGALAATSLLAQQPAPAPPPAAGQPPAAPALAPPKPYKPVTIKLPTAVADPSFVAFRKQIGDIAAKKDRAALAKLVAQSFFFVNGEKDAADKKKPGIDNLAKAISLDAKDGSGWDMVIGFASDPTAAPFPERKDTICAPAEPTFDAKELEALAKATGTEESDWGFPTQPNLEMRASAQPNAAVVEKLGMHFIRVMDDGAAPSGDNPMIKVVAPSGKVGFVPGDSVSPLGSDSICYAKEGGAWKITGFIGGEQ